MKSLPPKSDTDTASDDPASEGPMDLRSLMEGGVADRQQPKPQMPTDFETLKAEAFTSRGRLQKRTVTDALVDGITPIMIFVMVYSVIAFLLDVRFVYLSLQNVDWLARLYENTIRAVALCLVVGVVALNRLVARDGRDESILYIVGLVMATGLFTLSTTEQVGSVANNFMNEPYLATLFNITVVALIWWIANRLTHECCVDANPTAGEIGILTGTARRVHNAITKQPLHTGARTKDEPYILKMELEAYDPAEWKKREKPKAAAGAATKRLPKRHPGISVFYTSIPAMAIFATGQWVLRNGDIDLAFRANVCLLGYTVSALSLLMLSSLGGLREYFRERNVRIPPDIGPFWIGLGYAMVAFVIIGALTMPSPRAPAPRGLISLSSGYQARLAQEHTERAATQAGSLAEAMEIRYPQLIRYLGILETVVLIIMGLICAYVALRLLGAGALALSGKRGRVPRALARFFAALDRLLQRLLRLPSLPGLATPRRVSPNVALSSKFVSPLGDPVLSKELSPKGVIEYCYTAMCALAEDLAVPRRPDQTPFEFIESFPRALEGLREDAIRLTNLYVVSAYSNIELDERTLDTVRSFWRSYATVRDTVIR